MSIFGQVNFGWTSGDHLLVHGQVKKFYFHNPDLHYKSITFLVYMTERAKLTFSEGTLFIKCIKCHGIPIFSIFTFEGITRIDFQAQLIRLLETKIKDQLFKVLLA